MSAEPSLGEGGDPPAEVMLSARDQALAGVVERARRLQMSSVKRYGSMCCEENPPPPPPVEVKTDDVGERQAPPSGKTVKNPAIKRSIAPIRSFQAPQRLSAPALVRRLRKTESTHNRTPRGVQCKTALLPVPPPPPPPSPRCPQAQELCLALEQADALLIMYRQTDQLVDDLLLQALDIHRELELQWRLQRDVEMVRNLEVEANGRSLFYLIEAIQAECNSADAQSIRQRCLRALARSEKRFRPKRSQKEPKADSTPGKARCSQTSVDSTCSSAIAALRCDRTARRNAVFHQMMHYVESEILTTTPGEPAGLGLGLTMDMKMGVDPELSVKMEAPKEGPRRSVGSRAGGSGDGQKMASDSVTKSYSN